MVRTEYAAWQMEVELDYYEDTKDNKHLDNAEALAVKIMKMQSIGGGFYVDSKTKKVFSGEVGLVAWGFFRLYKITGNNGYLDEGDKALKYLERNPTIRRKDEPRLYHVFLAWNNYAYLVRSTISHKKKYLRLAERNAKILLDDQGILGTWTLVLHYDLYVARNLVFMYQYIDLGGKYLDAVFKFVDFAKKHTFLGLYPIHYFPFGVLELASGYSSNQFARLFFYLYEVTKDTDYYLDAVDLVSKIKLRLTKNDKVYKTLMSRDKNKLATMWLAHNRLFIRRWSNETTVKIDVWGLQKRKPKHRRKM